jgi:Zn-dependent protease with chaperone function
MENAKFNLKKIIFLYLFWFFIIAAVSLVIEYAIFNTIFFSSITIAGFILPASIVYPLFLAVAFSIAQYILRPKSPNYSTMQTTAEPSTPNEQEQSILEEPVEGQPQEDKEVDLYNYFGAYKEDKQHLPSKETKKPLLKPKAKKQKTKKQIKKKGKKK